jgi:hypothetical protein
VGQPINLCRLHDETNRRRSAGISLLWHGQPLEAFGLAAKIVTKVADIKPNQQA